MSWVWIYGITLLASFYINSKEKLKYLKEILFKATYRILQFIVTENMTVWKFLLTLSHNFSLLLWIHFYLRVEQICFFLSFVVVVVVLVAIVNTTFSLSLMRSFFSSLPFFVFSLLFFLESGNTERLLSLWRKLYFYFIFQSFFIAHHRDRWEREMERRKENCCVDATCEYIVWWWKSFIFFTNTLNS